MARTKLLQTNFTKGELSPLMMGRVDTQAYGNGAAQILNYVGTLQGPIVRRTGTKFIGASKFGTQHSILRDFQFSDLQAYVLDIGNLYVRIYFDGGFVETSPGSGTPLEVVTPYLAADVAGLKFTQSADVLYITHPAYPPASLNRLGANSWTYTPLVLLDGPYYTGFIADNTLNLTTVSDSALATAGGNIFTTSSTKNITGIQSLTQMPVSQPWSVTCPSHGFTTGAAVTIANIGGFLGALLPGSPVNYAAGIWIIDVIDANTFTLRGSVGVINAFATSGTAQLQTAAVGSYIEYLYNNIWGLSQVIQILTTSTAAVKVIDNILTPPVTVAITTSGTAVSSTFAFFSPNNVGMYIRATTGGWVKITGYINTSTCSCTVVSGIVTYSFPTQTTTVDIPNRLISITITAKSALFVSTDVGRLIRINLIGFQVPFTIGGVLSSTSAVAFGKLALPLDPTTHAAVANGGITNIFLMGAWSVTTGYPRACVFHQQRLIFGGSVAEPDNVWGSQSADFLNMAPTDLQSVVTDSCAITYTLVGNEANTIISMQTGPVLLVFTQGSEWKLSASGGGLDVPITPTNFVAIKQTKHGALANCNTQQIGYDFIFIQRAGRKMLELSYNYILNSYVAKNLTSVSEHIFRKGSKAVQTTYQQEPTGVIWVVLADGTFCGLTYDADQQVTSWHSHVLGGTAVVESLCCISSTAGTEDLLYLLVKRHINGSDVRYIEVVQPDFYPTGPQDKTKMFYLDCAQTYAGSAATTISGLSYLQGESVYALADGGVVGPFTVSGSGTITLKVAASNVIVGYSYLSLIQVCPLEGGSQAGSSQGKKKRVARTMVRLYNTLGMRFGEDKTKLDLQSFRNTSTSLNESPDMFTGDLVVNMPSTFSYTGQFFIGQDQPYPSTILAIAPDTEVTT